MSIFLLYDDEYSEKTRKSKKNLFLLGKFGDFCIKIFLDIWENRRENLFLFSEIVREFITWIFWLTSLRIFSRSFPCAIGSLFVTRSKLILRFSRILSIFILYDSMRKVLISLIVFSLSFFCFSSSCFSPACASHDPVDIHTEVLIVVPVSELAPLEAIDVWFIGAAKAATEILMNDIDRINWRNIDTRMRGLIYKIRQRTIYTFL